MRSAPRLRLGPSAEPSSAPAWFVTYADLMTLLLCLLVAILSMSTIRKDRFHQVLGSFASALGGPAPSQISNSSLDDMLKLIAPMTASGETELASILDTQGVCLRHSGEHRQLIIGGPLMFNRSGTEPSKAAMSIAAELGAALSLKPMQIIVRGHTSFEKAASGAGDTLDLAYARAAAIARTLQEQGVAPHRICVVAAGESEPLLDHTYTEARRALNRRVEIDIREIREKSEFHPAFVEKS